MYTWEKLGTVFTDEQLEQNETPAGWCKSGTIYPKKVNGYYWMFFGDTHIWAANSKDLRKWEIVKKPVLSPRPGQFDSYLVEPGPPPIELIEASQPPVEGIWLGYNSARKTESGELKYSFGHALLAPYDPTRVLRRCTRPLIEPTTEQEITGQVPNVVFGEGLVSFKGKWFLYYGMADSRIGVAVFDV